MKSRIPTEDLVTALTPQAADFLAMLAPTRRPNDRPLWNHYRRITLVSKQRAERVTLDLDLAFTRETDRAAMPGIVVAEVKYQGARHASEFARLMRSTMCAGRASASTAWASACSTPMSNTTGLRPSSGWWPA